MIAGIIAVAFEKPTTKDFVWPCWGPSIRVGGISFCMNFVFFLLLLAMGLYSALFYLAFRRPKTIPGRLQALMEMGLEFVREQIVMQMIGPEGMPFFALLSAFFFFIFFANILEVLPGVNLALTSRIAFPIVLAIVSWVTYNAVGIRRHGFTGYMKLVLFPPGAPIILYFLLSPIEFFTTILVRPVTLSVRLFANLVAGHFLLAVFFLGSIALLSSAVTFVFGLVSGAMAVVMVGFEIFVSLLQAFIFSVLSASYIAGAMASEH